MSCKPEPDPKPDVQEQTATRNSTREYDHFFTILLVGETGSGRACLLNRFIHNKFSSSTKPIGFALESKLIKVNGKTVLGQFMRNYGNANFRPRSSFDCSYAIGAILVYDTTDRRSYEKVETWLQLICRDLDQDVPITLVGTKNDLMKECEVKTEEAVEFAKENRLLFTETSAFDSTNVALAFEMTVAEVLRRVEMKRAELNSANFDDGKKCSVM